jgi:hypothetical protein
MPRSGLAARAAGGLTVAPMSAAGRMPGSARGRQAHYMQQPALLRLPPFFAFFLPFFLAFFLAMAQPR